jgi:hypothetical protein
LGGGRLLAGEILFEEDCSPIYGIFEKEKPRMLNSLITFRLEIIIHENDRIKQLI